MTTTVFLSGSRKISRLNDAIRSRLKNMIDQEFRIVVGDANGADKALQDYLSAAQYDRVVVFCAGEVCRNNLGAWRTKNINVDPKLKGRDFYTEKDKAMACEADYGFVLWDGKSSGSMNNVLELMKNHKPVVVYFGPDKTFYNIKGIIDVKDLLERCDIRDYESMNDKIHFDRRLNDLYSSAQETLRL